MPDRAAGISWIQRIRVPLGFAYAVLFILLADPVPRFLTAGLLLGLIGLLIRVWAAGHLRKHRELAVSGPYSLTRNPLYFGSFLLGLGLAAASSKLWLIVIFIVLFPAVHLPVMRREERELEKAYGEAFEGYRRSVPLFFPDVGKSMDPQAGNFQWRQVILNREQNAMIGFLIVAGYLIIKMSWR
ncbi:MAG TPA: isoprenylcysteine carboxylmethyltransferase family protein [Acidobacteriota bacterium]|nr:isoprenylcysteine carboxylmethyltransferase family protein [Acidobacteriota bacterium]